MKRILTKVGRFFWSWGFLKFVLWTITIIILFCVEEDWRGARAWAATKAKWEAKGVSFDRGSYVPPEVPDEQNLAALPLFRKETTRANGSLPDEELGELRRAMRSGLPGDDLPSTGGGGMAGTAADMGMIKTKIAAAYAKAFNNAPPPQGALAQFAALYPFVGELREAAKTRPYFRLKEDYLQPLAARRALGPITDQIKISKILTLHAILALNDHQPDVALADITLNLEITSGVLSDPSLVGGLVAIGMVAIGNPAICQGLALHTWSDAQLAQIQDELSRIDFLRGFQFAMHSEVVAESSNFDYIKNNRSDAAGNKFYGAGDFISYFVLRDGWLDQNKSRSATMLFEAAETVDPQTHRIYPEAMKDLKTRAEALQESWLRLAPWNILSALSVSPVIRGAQTFAEGQVYWIDETRMACALERYRLAHGAYPETLAMLVPSCIRDLPPDVINGEPYHYQLRPDGTYVLYSVGWNQKDDGGAVTYKYKDSHAIDFDQGDWVWQMPQTTATK